VVVAVMVLTMTSWLVRGRPRQFIEMYEKRRCSILWLSRHECGSIPGLMATDCLAGKGIRYAG